MIVYPFPYFRNFTTGTPTIPDIYWNCYSNEERMKKLCCEYDKIVKYLDAMADTVNSQYRIIEEINDNLPTLVADAVANDTNIRNMIAEKVQQYLDGTMVGTTYKDMTDHGFIYSSSTHV